MRTQYVFFFKFYHWKIYIRAFLFNFEGINAQKFKICQKICDKLMLYSEQYLQGSNSFHMFGIWNKNSFKCISSTVNSKLISLKKAKFEFIKN